MAAPPPVPSNPPPGMLRGIVKQVLSGDTIVVMGADSSRGPPPEKQVSLAFLSAPRLGNRSQPDMPFAWPAREFLRGWLIGKPVSFRIDYATPSGRQFGTVLTEDGRDVGLAVVMAGWARIFAPKQADGSAGPGDKPDASGLTPLDRLKAAEEAASAEQRGLWTAEEGAAARATREVDYQPDTTALLASLAKQKVTAVVEHVLSGSSLKLLLLPGFQNVTLLLAGVLTPSIRRNADTGAEEAQPFGRESKYFTESRVLHRSVRAELEGLDKSGTLVGSVYHVTQDINLGIELVKAGLGRVADWSAPMTTAAPALREAERAAKAARVGQWRGYTPPTAEPGMAEYQARVVEVVGPDVLVVTPIASAGAAAGVAEERRVNLSSVRAPRARNDRRGEEGEPHAHDSKEWTRRHAVGKKVRVVPEYKRKIEAKEGTPGSEATAGGSARPGLEITYAAVFAGDRNLAVELVGAGLASVNTFGRSEERSAHFDELLAAEAAAKEARLGMHSGKPSTTLTPQQCQDLTLPANRDRVKAFLPALQRDSRVRCQVLHVVHGGRYKVLIPKEACIASLALAGVRCPSTARRDQAGSVAEPFGDEAYALARATLLQRDVDVEVEGLDKNGTLLGFVHLPEAKRNFAVQLLEQGLARRIPPAADRTKHATALEQAERAARDARLRVWEGYEEEPETGADAAEAEDTPVETNGDTGQAAALAAARALPVIDITGTDVSDGTTFFAQPCGATDTAPRDAQRIEEALRGAASLPPLGQVPKVGALCAARFAGDKAFYRAKVTAVSDGRNSLDVTFIDYGNSQTVALSDCRALDPSLSTNSVPPLALCCKMAYLLAQPTEEEAGTDCAEFLSETVLGRAVRARVERRAGAELSLTVLLPGPEGSGGSASGAAESEADASPAANTLNAELVHMGLARVERRPDFKNAATAGMVAALRLLQDAAKKERMGMWRHGDVEEDDCKEFGYTPKPDNAWAKKK